MPGPFELGRRAARRLLLGDPDPLALVDHLAALVETQRRTIGRRLSETELRLDEADALGRRVEVLEARLGELYVEAGA